MQQYIGKIVQLIYVDSKRDVSIRNVKIYAVGDKQFKAHCYLANAVRTFNVEGIVDIEVLNKRLMGAINGARRYDKKDLSHIVK